MTSFQNAGASGRRQAVVCADRPKALGEVPIEAWETEEFACEIHPAAPVEGDARPAGVLANLEL